MTWQGIYAKYKDTELMEEFAYLYYIDRGFKKHMADFIKEHPDIKPSDHLSLTYLTIKDIWGYLLCFAETEEREINVMMIDDLMEGWVDNEMQEFGKTEQAMCWCANKFFEVEK